MFNLVGININVGRCLDERFNLYVLFNFHYTNSDIYEHSRTFLNLKSLGFLRFILTQLLTKTKIWLVYYVI